MPVVRVRSVLKGILVREAMRRQVHQLPVSASLDKCISHLIKHKASAVLVTSDAHCPAGVVSKTDLISAFYAGLPAESVLESIMNGPVLTCYPDDAIEDCLDLMRENRVHRLFVQGADPCSVIGTMSYPDVVSLLYRYCRICPQGAVKRSESAGEPESESPTAVHEVMTNSVVFCRETDSLSKVIEELCAHRLGAVLIRDDRGLARGVISKTDAILAYRHRTGLDTEARSIMRSPVVSCRRDCLLTDAIRQMFLHDVQRLFVHSGDPAIITGVLSLSDAAQVRSGSCRACIASRIITAPEA